MSLPSLTRWNASTDSAARGSCWRMARRNAADGSIATTWLPSRQACAPGREPSADAGGVPAVDDAADAAGVGVDDGGHPRLEPPPGAGGVSVEPDGTVAVLVDAEPPHDDAGGVGEQDRGVKHGALRGAGQAMRGGDLGHHASGPHDRVQYDSPQSGGRPGAQRDLGADLDERPPRAAGLGAGEASLDQNHLEPPGDRDVPKTPVQVRWCTRPDSTPADPGHAALDRDRGDDHLSAAVRQVQSGFDAVSGQVEQRARRVPRRARSVAHGSWSPSG